MTFNILQLKEEDGHENSQIFRQLWNKSIECVFVDSWGTDLVIILGCSENTEKIASCLKVHPLSIYNDFQHSLVIINLVEEKIRRGYPIEEIIDE